MSAFEPTEFSFDSGESLLRRRAVWYECSHDIPVAFGGLTVAANLWPQPNIEAARKDRLEIETQRLACVAYRTLTQEDAAKVLADEQREIGADQRSIGPKGFRGETGSRTQTYRLVSQ